MLLKPWGAAWQCQYKPQVGGEYVAPVSASPSPAVYIFDRVPSDLEARDGTNKIATGSAWSYSGTTKIATFTVPKIDYPDDNTRRRQYWMSIVFALETSGDLIYDVRPFWLTLPDGMDENPVPTAAELISDYFTTADDHYTTDQITAWITAAERSVKRDLKWKGEAWPRVENVGDLRDAIAYKTIMKMFFDLIDDGSDWLTRYNEAKEEYKAQLAAVVIVRGDDKSDTGKDPEAKPQSNVSFLIR